MPADKIEKEMFLCRSGKNAVYGHLIRLLPRLPFFHKENEEFINDGQEGGQLHENIGIGGEVSKFLPYVENGKCYKVKVTFEIIGETI